jgi:uncharacterized membrane protein
MNKRLLIGLFALAAVLRLGFLWLAPFWYDENFSLILAKAPFHVMWAAMLGDVHPPLYYLLIWPLGQLLNVTGWPVWILRIPSALLSLAAVYVFWRILEAFEPSARVRLAALVLMAIMPVGLYYAQEARMYALLEFLVLAAFLALWKRSWGWFMVLCVLILYTQNYGIYYVPALCLAGLLRDRSDWYELIVAGLKSAAFYLLWIPALLAQMHAIQGVYWMHADQGTPLVTLFRLLFMPDNNSVLQIPLMLAGFGWLFAAVLYGLFQKGPNSPAWLSYRLPLFCMAFLPLGLAALSSVVWQPVLYYRPLIGSAPFLFLLLAGPVKALFWKYVNTPRTIEVLYAACFILPLLLVVDGMQFVYSAQNKSFNKISQDLKYIQNHWQTGDVILNTGDDPWVSLYPYAPDLPQYRISDCAAGIGGLSQATRDALGVQNAPAGLQFKRAWIIWEFTPLSRVPRNCVADKYGLDIDRPLAGKVVNEYVDAGVWLVEGK